MGIIYEITNASEIQIRKVIYAVENLQANVQLINHIYK